ncbi:MAG TPA: hypothetical protein VIK18_06105, partial [Pirellulales bacterium]
MLVVLTAVMGPSTSNATLSSNAKSPPRLTAPNSAIWFAALPSEIAPPLVAVNVFAASPPPVCVIA